MAAVESVASLEHADSALASGAPSLPLFEPRPALQSLPLGTSCVAIGYGHMTQPYLVELVFTHLGVERGIGRDQSWRSLELSLMRLNRWHQKVTVPRSFIEDLVHSNNL